MQNANSESSPTKSKFKLPNSESCFTESKSNLPNSKSSPTNSKFKLQNSESSSAESKSNLPNSESGIEFYIIKIKWAKRRAEDANVQSPIAALLHLNVIAGPHRRCVSDQRPWEILNQARESDLVSLLRPIGIVSNSACAKMCRIARRVLDLDFRLSDFDSSLEVGQIGRPHISERWPNFNFSKWRSIWWLKISKYFS